MLINFTVKNWKSFRDETTLSMLKTKEQQHKDTIPKSEKCGISILPVAAIYGANASGKSNLFKALEFVQDFIVSPPNPDNNVEVERFKLDTTSQDNPSEFKFDLLIEETRYEYYFSINDTYVLEEKLLQVQKYGEDIVLFYRKGDGEKYEFEVSDKLDEKKGLEYTHKDTRPNMLFLSKTIDNNKESFRKLYNWFRYNLILISPDSNFDFKKHPKKSQKLLKIISTKLSKIDSGIVDIDMVESSLPSNIFTDIDDQINDKIVASLIKKSLSHRIVFQHKGSKGVKFSLDEDEQSDGTIRFMNLLPPFTDCEPFNRHKSHTVFIDEIDRSLHTVLTRKFIEAFLDTCSNNSSNQLIFSTHDVLLMDQDLLRRDEMWLTKKDEKGASEIFSLVEFKGIRYDMDIGKNYIFGRFGGIPKIGNLSFDSDREAEE